ncbi:MAG: ABC transporter permease subunit [Verrucomicrobia bacterium]|nr:ABC transporter permease subunit [Verrucomicrobiota bacterium]
MTFLPIVDRELRVAARRAGTFRVRIAVALVTSFLAAGSLTVGAHAVSAQTGKSLFVGLGVLAFVFCLIDGTRQAADSLSEEKREGTMGLLFLTDLRGYDVVLGKFAATSIKSFQGLFAFLPVLATAFILGGVTHGEFWRTAVVLVNTLFFSTSLGLWISAVSRESHRALSATLGLAALAGAAPVIVQKLAGPLAGLFPEFLARLSPGYSGLWVSDAMYQANPDRFWISILATHVLSWGFLIVASWVVPRAWREKPSIASVRIQAGTSTRRFAGNFEERAQFRRQLLDASPLCWLASRNQQTCVLIWAFVGSACAGSLLLAWVAGGRASVPFAAAAAVATILVSLVLKVWLASQASSHLAEARQNGTIELLLSTPLTTEEMIEGLWRALQRYFLGPVLVVLAVRVLTIMLEALSSPAVSSSMLGLLPSVGGVVFETLTLIVDFVAVAWTGMWMGLTQKNPHMAFAKTLLFCVVMPIVVFCVPNVLIDLVLISLARPKLRREMRRLVAERFAAVSPSVRRPRTQATPPKGTVPPVISRRS